MSSSFRHGQMHKVLKNRYGPMSQHKVLTQPDDDDQRPHTDVRVPLSQHPLFTRPEDNVLGCDRNVRYPLSQHPLFTQSNENEHPNIGLRNNGFVKENIHPCIVKAKRALAKSFSGRIPLSEHPMVKDSVRKVSDFNAKVQCLRSKGASDTDRSPCSSAMLSKFRIDENEMVPRKTLKRKYNCSLEEVSRSLSSDADYSTPNDFDDSVYSTIENSRIVGVDDSDDGMFSDDDMDATSTGDVLSDCDVDSQEEHVINNRTVPVEYASLGAPSFKYQFCQAYMWKEERVNKNITRGRPLFSIYCRKGHVRLPNAPPTPSFLWQIYTDPKKGAHFKRCSRMYNSMFSFTSTGGTVDNSINNGGGPYIYRLNGQNHHVTTSNFGFRHIKYVWLSTFRHVLIFQQSVT